MHGNGARGDMADSFAFATFFPNVVQPPIAVICNTIFSLLVKVGKRKDLQGDQAACSESPVDIDLKVAFQYKVLILKHNFQINVNERFEASGLVTL